MVSDIQGSVIPFYLVSGFLGSGKTTFLKNVLSEFACNNRIAIIQNEFASSGIDGKELKMSGIDFKLVEVNNGSVFCICKMGTFIQSLKKLVTDYQPEMVFLESSGLADPVNIIELLQKEEIRLKIRLEHIFTIVDAPNFERGMQLLPRVKNQIMIADTVIINKSDIYNGKLSVIRNQVKNMNPFARIIETIYCKADLNNLVPSGNKFFSSDPSNDNKHEAAFVFHGRKSDGKPSINACVLKTHEKITIEGLQSFIYELQKSSPRIKGYVNLQNGKVMAVHSIFYHMEIKEIFSYKGISEMIVFGEDITPRNLRNLFKNFII